MLCEALGLLYSRSFLWLVEPSELEVGSVKSAAFWCSMERRQVVRDFFFFVKVTYLTVRHRLCCIRDGRAQRATSVLSIDSCQRRWTLPLPPLGLCWSLHPTCPHGWFSLYQPTSCLRFPRCLLYTSHSPLLVSTGTHLDTTLCHCPHHHRPRYSNLHARRLRVPLICQARNELPKPQDL